MILPETMCPAIRRGSSYNRETLEVVNKAGHATCSKTVDEASSSLTPGQNQAQAQTGPRRAGLIPWAVGDNAVRRRGPAGQAGDELPGRYGQNFYILDSRHGVAFLRRAPVPTCSRRGCATRWCREQSELKDGHWIIDLRAEGGKRRG